MKVRGNRHPSFAALLLSLMGASCSRRDPQPETEVEQVSPKTHRGSSREERNHRHLHGSNVRVWGPGEGDRLWVFPESKDELGPGGEFHIYVDHETEPNAKASFAKFSLGLGGALAEHRHETTEELAYLLSGRGVVVMRENGKLKELPVEPGSVWYVPPAAWHTLENTAQEPMTLVFATIPNHDKSLLSFFRKVGAKPGVAPAVFSKEALAKLGAEHDFVRRPPDAQ